MRRDLKEIDANIRDWILSVEVEDYDCGIELPGFISHGVSKCTFFFKSVWLGYKRLQI